VEPAGSDERGSAQNLAEGLAQGAQGRHPMEPAGGLASGVGLIFEAFGLLRRERSLWKLSLAPVGFSLIAVTLGLAGIVTFGGDLYDLIRSALPFFDVEVWYQWIWLGPLRLLFWLAGVLGFLVTAGLVLVAALMLASIAAAPFLDALSLRVEQIVSGCVVESADQGVGAMARDIGRSLAGEIQRMVFFLGLWALLFGAGFVVPGAHLITGPLLLVLTIGFLPLEYSGYTLDRRQVPFRDRRAWLGAQWPRMAGFGGAAFLACFVPGMNLVMMPVLVVAGTLLVLRAPPAARH
jgi:CysZ protein